jgi:HSP20 family protein
MNLVRWNNQAHLSNIYHQLFNEAYTHKSVLCESTKPATNIQETEEGFELELAIPGLKKEDVKINLENSILKISTENTKEEVKYSRKEFSYQGFNRSFRLPKSADVEKIKATHENGVLSINIPKKEEAKEKLSREISIS